MELIHQDRTVLITGVTEIMVPSDDKLSSEKERAT